MPETDWSPERKIVAAAVATVVMVVVGAIVPEFEMPVGVEGAVAVIVGYFTPNAK
jgi:hypothetical protein